jgi:KaiC/GvpD/RAD55 family RecA-like ATPase
LCPIDSENQPAAKTEHSVIGRILAGDIPINTSIALIGAPGTGTSIMATQVVVNSLRRGKKVSLVLYDYAPKLADKYFRFFGFDPAPFKASGKLRVLDGYDLLRQAMGISSFTDIVDMRPIEFDELSKVFQVGLMSKILENQSEPTTIVIDSFTAISPFIDARAAYEMNAEGFVRMRSGKHSSLIVAHEGVLESNFTQVLTRFVDGVVRLRVERTAKGLARELLIEKMRFTNLTTPLMDFMISNDGISLLVGGRPLVKESSGDSSSLSVSGCEKPLLPRFERIATGIPELDRALLGGFPRGTSICVEGDVGTGTSTFCTQFVWSTLLAGGIAFYVCVDGPPSDVIEQFQSLGWDAGPYIDRNSLILSDAYSLFRSSRRESLKGAKESGAARKLIGDFIKAEREKFSEKTQAGTPVVAAIDSFTTIAPYLDLKTAYVLARFTADMARTNDQTYLTVVRSGTVEANLLHAFLGNADGILNLENAWTKARAGSSGPRRLIRKMRVEKMAFTPIPPKALEYEITSRGLILSKFK